MQDSTPTTYAKLLDLVSWWPRNYVSTLFKGARTIR